MLLGQLAVELVEDRRTRKPAKALTTALGQRCAERGVLLISAGTSGNILRFLLPLVISDAELDKERARRTIAVEAQGEGRWEVPVVRLLDHLEAAERRHPDLLSAYRSLSLPQGAPGEWRHYVDPWSRLPPPLRPLRVQMNFSSFDVLGYAKTDASRRRPRLQFSTDRSMNRTPGVNEMRLALFAPPPAAFTFRMQLPPRATLAFGTGVPQNGPRGEVTFLVEIESPDRPLAQVARFVVERRN